MVKMNLNKVAKGIALATAITMGSAPMVTTLSNVVYAEEVVEETAVIQTTLGNVDEAKKQITDVSEGTTVANLKADLKAKDGAKIEILDKSKGSAVVDESTVVTASMVIQVTPTLEGEAVEYTITLQTNKEEKAAAALLEGKKVEVSEEDKDNVEKVLVAIKEIDEAKDNELVKVLKNEDIKITDGKATVTFVEGVTAEVTVTVKSEENKEEKAAAALLEGKKVEVSEEDKDNVEKVLVAIKEIDEAKDNELVKGLTAEGIKIIDGKATVTFVEGVTADVTVTVTVKSEENKVDKAALQKAIKEVKYVWESKDGLDVEKSEKWTTKDAKTTLGEAVKEAQAVVDNEQATKENVEEAVKKLEEAVKAYGEVQKDGIKEAPVVETIKVPTEDKLKGYKDKVKELDGVKDKEKIEKANKEIGKIEAFYRFINGLLK